MLTQKIPKKPVATPKSVNWHWFFFGFFGFFKFPNWHWFFLVLLFFFGFFWHWFWPELEIGNYFFCFFLFFWFFFGFFWFFLANIRNWKLVFWAPLVFFCFFLFFCGIFWFFWYLSLGLEYHPKKTKKSQKNQKKPKKTKKKPVATPKLVNWLGFFCFFFFLVFFGGEHPPVFSTYKPNEYFTLLLNGGRRPGRFSEAQN